MIKHFWVMPFRVRLSVMDDPVSYKRISGSDLDETGCAAFTQEYTRRGDIASVLVYVGRLKDDREMVNIAAHEAEHVRRAVLRIAGSHITDEEGTAYMLGDIAEKISAIRFV